MRSVSFRATWLLILLVLVGSSLLTAGCSSGPNTDTSSIQQTVKAGVDANKDAPKGTGGSRN